MKDKVDGPIVGTILYPLKAIGIGSWSCESVGSFMRRLAFQHCVRYAKLKSYLSEIYPAGSGWRDPFNSPEKEAEALTLATGCAGLHQCALLPFRNDFALSIGGIDGAGRYCPACIEESPFPDAWGRVLWDIAIVDACPVHAVELMSCSCLNPTVYGVANAPDLFGVCPWCGSVSYGCHQRPARRASGNKVIVASQMAGLVAAISGGKKFDRSVAAEAVLCHLADDFGSVLAASRFFRMDVNQLYHLGRRSRLSVDLLMTICVTTGASLVGLLDGIIERAYQPSDLVPLARRKATRNSELAAACRQAANKMPGISVYELARTLRVTPREIEVAIPELAATMRGKKEFEEASRRRARRQSLVQTLHEIRREVEATGGGLTECIARSKTGRHFRTGTESRRILDLVIRGRL
ncbi:TniQ family protein [Paraburkholderia sp. USG1]|uniref:TniQ family protein n=1 Tax=Paraburkholderia sp. USG1 TaxID=2952268 RepID=UPI0028704E6C|nr:TniQ family protein [Paraburkholderia sp. USG1]